MHAVARAFDWHYANRGQAEEVLDTITGPNGIGHVLGVQAVHDYYVRLNNGSHWGSHSAPGHTWGHGQGWHYGHIGPGYDWLHIELTREASVDPNLMARVGVIGNVSHPHARPGTRRCRSRRAHRTQPAALACVAADQPAERCVRPLASEPNKPVIHLNSRGQAVMYAQSVIHFHAGGNITIDGHAGPSTIGRIKDVQKFFGLTVDGSVGQQTWRTLDFLATK